MDYGIQVLFLLMESPVVNIDQSIKLDNTTPT